MILWKGILFPPGGTKDGIVLPPWAGNRSKTADRVFSAESEYNMTNYPTLPKGFRKRNHVNPVKNPAETE